MCYKNYVILLKEIFMKNENKPMEIVSVMKVNYIHAGETFIVISEDAGKSFCYGIGLDGETRYIVLNEVDIDNIKEACNKMRFPKNLQARWINKVDNAVYLAKATDEKDIGLKVEESKIQKGQYEIVLSPVSIEQHVNIRTPSDDYSA